MLSLFGNALIVFTVSQKTFSQLRRHFNAPVILAG
jgi:hypothetical protein